MKGVQSVNSGQIQAFCRIFPNRRVFLHRLFPIFGGLFAATLAVLPAAAMSYRLIEAELPSCRGACPGIIIASGTIQQNEHLIFADFVETISKNQRLSSMLVVESPGGFNGGAAMLGMVLRKLKMTVIVGRPLGGTVTRETGLTSGTCASACVLVLAGGASRYFVTGSRVGVHRAHTGGEVRDPTTRAIVSGRIEHDNVKSAYARYFKMMGIDHALSSVMDKTPSESMHWLSPAELGKFRLARDSSTKR